MFKNFSPPSPDPSPTGEGDTPPSLDSIPLGALILALSALGIPIPFHLRLEHWKHCAASLRQQSYLLCITILCGIFAQFFHNEARSLAYQVV